MSKLAIDGGNPVRTRPLPEYRTIGEEEKTAVAEVLDSGILSAFLGTWSTEFFGGPRVRQLEKDWTSYFGIAHAVSMNSATSGLYAALGAAGIGPGDEVIVSPYTMSASAAGPLLYNAIPVFADIDPETFCISANTIAKVLTARTKAIVVVDLFGHPAEMHEIMKLAMDHGLIVIEDAAQAPGAMVGNLFAGTLGHIGVFSLNYHKHIHSGEGAVVVTNDGRLAEKLQLIRNHAEVVLQNKPGGGDLNNMLGFNYRMTEIEAAIASEQLKKLGSLLSTRIDRVNRLTDLLSDIDGIQTPVVRPLCVHAYYLYALRYDAKKLGIPRARFAQAVRAEGVPIAEGYVAPIYLQPLYQQRRLFGGTGSPWTDPTYKGWVSYDRGICPVAEQMHFKELLYMSVHGQMAPEDLSDIAEAVHKVSQYYRKAAA